MPLNGKLPKGWASTTLGNFLTESRVPGSNGKDAKKLTVRLYGRGIVVKQENRPGSTDTQFYRRMAGQLVYSKLDFLNGAIAVVPGSLDGYETSLDLPAFNISDVVDRRWLLSYLTQPWFYQNCKHAARGGRRAKRVYEKDFLGLVLRVPPRETQRVIADTLDAASEYIEAVRAVLEQTVLIKENLQQLLLRQGYRKSGSRKSNARHPDGWTLERVGKLCEFSSGTGFSHTDWSNTGLPIIRIQNLNGSSSFNYYEGEPDPKWIVEPGELLFAWAGVKGVSFGPCVWSGPRGLLNQHIYRVRPNPGVDRRWLYSILGEITHRIEAKAHGFKTSLVHVHKADITDQIVAVPQQNEQIQIARQMEVLEHWEATQKDYLKQLESTKTALSQGLLTGTIQVPLGKTS